MRRAAGMVVWLVALGGCDRVFGLAGRDAAADDDGGGRDGGRDDGALCTDDIDCDQVLDPVDNCPDVANSDQDDTDRDDIGDACDPCGAVAGGTNDDDGDGLRDEIDNCPARSNSGQQDADGDQVGDACDPRPAAPDVRTCFYAFDAASQTKTELMWGLSGPWTTNASLISHFPAATAPFVVRGEGAGLLASYGGYVLQLRFDTTAAPSAAFEVGVGVGTGDPGDPGVRCVWTGTFSDMPALSIVDAAGGTIASVPTPIYANAKFLEMQVMAQGPTTAIACQLGTDSVAAVSTMASVPALATVPMPRLISVEAYTQFASLDLFHIEDP